MADDEAEASPPDRRPIVVEALNVASTQIMDVVGSAVRGEDAEDRQSCRGLAWRVWLGVLPPPTDSEPHMLAKWAALTQQQREQYDVIKHELTAPPADDGDDPLMNNPLSFSESSAWAEFHRSRAVLDEIGKDVQRLYPDGCGDFFASEEMQNLMSSILFVWSLKHKSLSYRQGMHEVLALLVWTLLSERVGPSSAALGTDDEDDLDDGDGDGDGSGDGAETDAINGGAATSTTAAAAAAAAPDMDNSTALDILCSSAHVEHDAFWMFSGLMDQLGGLFDANDTAVAPVDVGQSPSSAARNAMELVAPSSVPEVLKLCARIQHQRLRNALPDVHGNLVELGVEPQLYGLRWTRLLFMREFPVGVLEPLWDAMFASHFLSTQDPSDVRVEGPAWTLLDSLEWVSCALLVQQKERLAVPDYTTVLTALMRLPPSDDSTEVWKLARTIEANGGKPPAPPPPPSPPPPPPSALPSPSAAAPSSGMAAATSLANGGGGGGGGVAAPEPSLEEILAVPPDGHVPYSSLRRRMLAFYTKNNPTKVKDVDLIMSSYHGKEKALMAALYKRYGTSPVGNPSKVTIVRDGSPPGSPSRKSVDSVFRSFARGAEEAMRGAGAALKKAVKAPRHAVNPSPASSPLASSSASAAPVVPPAVPRSGPIHPIFTSSSTSSDSAPFIALRHPNARPSPAPSPGSLSSSASSVPVAANPAPAPGRASTAVQMGHRLETLLPSLEDQVSRVFEVLSNPRPSATPTSVATSPGADPLTAMAAMEGSETAGEPSEDALPDQAALHKCVSDLKVIRDVLLGRLSVDDLDGF